jgi:hypothetical protein
MGIFCALKHEHFLGVLCEEPLNIPMWTKTECDEKDCILGLKKLLPTPKFRLEFYATFC